MSEEIQKPSDSEEIAAATVANRRRLLKLGAASVPAIVSLKGGSALAQTGASLGLSRCTVTVPVDAVRVIEDDNTIMSERTFTADEVAGIVDGDPSTVVTTPENDTEYLNYLKNQINNGGGLSCVLSIELAVTRV